MYNEFNEPDNTISKALRIIDPEGAFVPGMNEYKWLEGSLQSWMETLTSDEVLRKSGGRNWGQVSTLDNSQTETSMKNLHLSNVET